MIVCRSPFTIYDVDVLGFAALVLLALAECFAVILPADANATEHSALSARIAATHDQMDRTGARLRKLGVEIETLQAGLAARADAAPRPGVLTPFLQRLAALAEECQMQIAQVLPHPPQAGEGYVYNDIELSARGAALDSVRWLHRLTREYPYCALQKFEINRTITPVDERCQMSWTLRMYMLANESRATTGQPP